MMLTQICAGDDQKEKKESTEARSSVVPKVVQMSAARWRLRRKSSLILSLSNHDNWAPSVILRLLVLDNH